MIPFLSGRMRCTECRATWGGTWNTHSPQLTCHLCGGTALPDGPQRLTADGENEIDAEMWRLDVRAVRRVMS